MTRVLDDLDKLQAKHINSFDTQILPDLEQQCRERDLSIDCLKKKMGELMGTLGHQPTEEIKEILFFFRARLSALLKQNRDLEKKVRIHKDGIEKSMQKISTGKKIIHSYGSPSLVLNSPKVISFTE